MYIFDTSFNIFQFHKKNKMQTLYYSTSLLLSLPEMTFMKFIHVYLAM